MDRILRYLVTGEDRGASATLSKTAQAGEAASSRIGGAFQKLGGVIGGEFGELLNKAGEGLDQFGQKAGKSLSAKLEVGGGALMALGGAMTLMGSKSKAAEQQLKAAIDASGHSYDDYEKQIKKAINSMENFGHSETDTMQALQVLTAATNDPAKALQNMGLVADLAAAKHISLADAASQVAKVYGGSGKVLKQYGITLDSASKNTAELTKDEKAHEQALTTLAAAQKRLSELTTIDLSKTKLSVADQITLRKAHDAVTAAVKAHGEKSVQAQKADQALADTEARLTAKTQLSTSAQLQLKDAQQKVAAAQSKAADTAEQLAGAQGNQKTQTQLSDQALGQLSQKLKGQAAAASDTWLGKLNAMQSHLADFAAKVAQKYGPAFTILGGTFNAVGNVIGFFRQRQIAAALTTEANARATTAETDAIVREGAAASTTATEMTGLATARARAGAAAVGGAAESEAGAAAGAGRGALGGAGPLLAIGAAIVGVGLAINKLDGDNKRWADMQNQITTILGNGGKAAKDFAAAIEQDGNKLGTTTQTMVIAQAQSNGLADSFQKAGLSLVDVTRAVTGNNQTFDQLLNTWRSSAHPSSDLVVKLEEMRSAYYKGQAAAQTLTNRQNALNSALNAMKPPEPLHLKVIDDASHKIGIIKSELLGLDGRTVQTFVEVDVTGKGADYGVTGGTHGGRSVRADAEGTDFSPGGLTTINERGQEQIYLPRGAKVVPRSSGNNGMGGTYVKIDINVAAHPGSDMVAAGRNIAKALEPYLQSGGRINGLS